MYLRGPEVQATTNTKEVLKILKRRMKKLQSFAIKNPTEETAPDRGAEPGDPLRVFGTPEHRKKVEKAAEETVKKHYRAKGFLCTDDDDVTKKNLGFDFIFRKGSTERHVEVKGTSGDLRRFFMTRRKCLPGKPKVEICNRYECVGPGSDGLCLQQSAVQENLRA